MYKNLGIISGLILLQACNSGGGSSAVETPAATPAAVTPAAVIPPQIGTGKYTLDEDEENLATISTTANGNALVYDANTKLITVDGVAKPAASVNSVGYIKYNISRGALYGTYFDKDGTAHSYSTYITDFSDPNMFTFTKIGGNYTWDNVEYGVSSDGTGTDILTSGGSDGKITVNTEAGTWNAVLGPVTLTGAISGTNVSGTSTFNGISGTFKGDDGFISDYDTYLTTVGSFAGQNSTDTYAGGWFQFKTPSQN